MDAEQKIANEEACRIFGHMPVPKTNQEGHEVATIVVCDRCGVKLL